MFGELSPSSLDIDRPGSPNRTGSRPSCKGAHFLIYFMINRCVLAFASAASRHSGGKGDTAKDLVGRLYSGSYVGVGFRAPIGY